MGDPYNKVGTVSINYLQIFIMLSDHLNVIEWHEWIVKKYHSGPLGRILHDIDKHIHSLSLKAHQATFLG